MIRVNDVNLIFQNWAVVEVYLVRVINFAGFVSKSQLLLINLSKSITFADSID